MKYLEAKVTFDHSDPALAADLVAGVFFEFDLQGVVIEDPGLEPPADDWAEDAVARPARHSVSGYLPLDERLERRCKLLEQALAETADRIGMVWRVSLPRAGRAELGGVLEGVLLAAAHRTAHRRQAVLARVRAGARRHRAGHRPGDGLRHRDPPDHVALHRADRGAPRARRDSFLDVGTGSGILMLAAAKLGSRRVCGGDRDELAVRIAADNLRRNGVPPERVCLAQGP